MPPSPSKKTSPPQPNTNPQKGSSNNTNASNPNPNAASANAPISGDPESLLAQIQQIQQVYIKDGGILPDSYLQEYDNLIADAFGKGFTAAFGPGYQDTNSYLQSWLATHQRPDSDPPNPVQSWQCRIGASNFFVPPLNIDVSQNFQTGSLTGAAIRQMSSPKFNSGHHETTIRMTLYFPNVEQIWGYDNGYLNINFDTDPNIVIDKFLSSLRGLIVQFKYAPFLPIVNDYLNGVWNINSVAMKNMSIDTVADFPFVIKVDLEMNDFDHQVFLPQTASLDDSIDWSKFRQYVGRAAVKMDAAANQAFASTANNPTQGAVPQSIAANLDPDRGNQPDASGTDPVLNTDFGLDVFNAGNASALQIYFPDHDPAQFLGPTNFAWGGTSNAPNSNIPLNSGVWTNVLGMLGWNTSDPNNAINLQFENIQQLANAPTIQQEMTFVKKYLDLANATSKAASGGGTFVGFLMGNDPFQKFKSSEYVRMGIAANATGNQKLVADQTIYGAWFSYIYNALVANNGLLSQIFAIQDYLRGTIEIDEWDVPMVPLQLDPKKFIVDRVSVALANNFARMQLNMLDRPAYQHIGGLDTIIRIAAFVTDSAQLTLIRNMFDIINGLSRLEHSHAVLGFLGIKNNLIALAGTRYVVPKTFEVNTVPGYPNTYEVVLEFLDFDVFQQKRELLSSTQEQQFIDLMSKRNPFLRLTQCWSCVDTETEILTTSGWKDYKQLQLGEYILTLNHETGFSEWQPIEKVWIYNNVDTELLSIEGKVHSSLTTYNHRWPILHKNRLTDNKKKTSKVINETREWRLSEELNSNDNLITAAVNIDIPIEPKYKDAFVEIVAWLWTEGSMVDRVGRSTPRTAIYQSHKINPQNVSRIKYALTSLFGPAVESLGDGRKVNPIPHWREQQRSGNSNMTMFILNSAAVCLFTEIMNKKVISSEFIRSLTRSQLELFINISMLGDQQQWDGNKGSITQSNKDRLEAIELAAILLGHSTSLAYRALPAEKTSIQNPQKEIYHRYYLGIHERNTYRIPAKKDQKWIRYQGTIWCPTVHNGSWLARRNGHTYFTGNCFNAYPDFPLAIRDDQTQAIAGYLDPDYYFHSFQAIDDDIVYGYADPPKYQKGDQPAPQATSNNSDYHMTWHFGPISDSGEEQSIGLSGTGFDLRSGNTIVSQGIQHNDPHIGNTHTQPFVQDSTGKNPSATPPNLYMHPNFEYKNSKSGTVSNSNNGSSKGNFQGMLSDLQYRNLDGRMIRAFPSYMLWLIDEGGTFAGINLFSNFYGLQSVIDFSLVESQDIMGDTLVLRISNLYSRLSTAYQDLIDPSIFPQMAALVNNTINTVRNIASGLNPSMTVNISTINLQPGARLHLRVGYGNNPNMMETIFNGMVTEVQQGDIITITAQSDAIELGAIVDSSNKKGSSSTIDGSLTNGFYLSEPRDLMVRLLSMGASTFKEALQYATKGMIFSQNKFGIRHFGNILYDTMTKREEDLSTTFSTTLDSISGDINTWLGGAASGTAAGLLNPSIGTIAAQMWTNINSQRDYEIFKRNIYPGNGLGVAQYMGGDLGDGGINTAFQPPGIDTSGNAITTGPDPVSQLNAAANIISGKTGTNVSPSIKSNSSVGSSINAINNTFTQGPFSNLPLVGIVSTGEQVVGNVVGGIDSHLPLTAGLTAVYNNLHPIWQMLGIQPTVTDDVPGKKIPILGTYGPFAEISFKAETYQKTIWDLFVLCAKLLPNYIVAVRPFMERSTVFYGKPHWAYTSGVIPLTYGVTDENGPSISSYDHSIQEKIQQIMGLMNQNKGSTQQDLYNRLNNLTPDQLASGDTSLATTSGTSGGPGSVGGNPNAVSLNQGIDQLPLKHPQSGAIIPARNGPTCIEMHIPTSADLQTDIKQHQQLTQLPNQFRHPFYMDRGGGSGVGGVGQDQAFNPNLPITSQTEISGQNPNAAGHPGAFGILDPADEQYYMNMRWSYQPSKGAYLKRKILVFNPANSSGCICTPGDYGPGVTSRVSGISPDTWWVLGQPSTNATLWYGFVDDTTPLGPIQWQQGDTFKGNQLPVGASPTATATGQPVDANSQGNTNADGTVTDATIPPPPALSTLEKLAQNVYSDNRSTDDAKEIWKEFDSNFPTDPQTKAVFQKAYPDKMNMFQQIVKEFVNWMDSNAYNLGWLALTADNAKTIVGDVEFVGDMVIDPLSTVVAPLVSGFEQGLGLPKGVQTVTNDIFNYGTPLGLGKSIFNSVVSFFGGADPQPQFDFSRARKLFGIWITEGPGQDTGNTQDANNSTGGAIEWMIANASPGLTSNNVIGQAEEKFGASVGATIKHAWDDLNTIKNVILSGITDLFRWTQTLFNMGVSLSGFSGKQANLLSAVFNDSYYYDPALGIGSLLWQADNCFTREYGEPVIEIRQPFQRVHYINSLQHIIANGISETMNGVYTVCTASSKGNEPHTVYFDKGAPTNIQYEMSVDTGLYLDSPHWYSYIIHPSHIIQDFVKHMNNSDDGTECVRFARASVAQSLKGIYTGEIFILGDPSIRPFDLLYISDNYERIYGLCQVEQVVHHFTPELGFVTAITPAAIVTVNDPERWEAGSIMQRQLAIQDIRNLARRQAGITNNAQAGAGTSKTTIDPNQLALSMQSTLEGTTQFSGGASAILKDIAGSSVMGGVRAAGVAIPGISQITGFLGWEAFKWLRSNFLDTHACYINYLNRNGTHMDAGLSYAQGVAVGQLHVWEGLSQALGISIPYTIDGQANITETDLLSNLGWTQTSSDQLGQDVDFWTQQTRAQILALSGKQPEGNPANTQVYTVEVQVLDVVDSVTLHIKIINGPVATNGFGMLRLAYIVAPENINAKNDSALLAILNPTIAGAGAIQYMQQIFSDPTNATCYVRVNPAHVAAPDNKAALLGSVFYQIDPTNLTNSIIPTRLGQLSQDAANYPNITWQDYRGNGTPYTLNWELVTKGYATVDVSAMFQTSPGLVSPALGMGPSGFTSP